MKEFLELAQRRYHDYPASDEHEMEHNHGHKKAWGRAGIKALREIAKVLDADPAGIGHNPSGSIDRGYISCFLTSPDGTKFVYVSINDGMSDILFRTAEHAKDYTGGRNNTVRIDEAGFAEVVAFTSQYFKS